MTGLKKNCASLTHKNKVALIDKSHPVLSIGCQADLLEISRSSIYYAPRVSVENLRIMRGIDELYTKYPFYGSRRMKFALQDESNIVICREHVQRLMRLMGIEAIYPKKGISIPAPDRQIYPYLLRNLAIARPDQVWSSDITYVRLEKGFCYLTVILDWYSRCVLAWELSETIEATFCARALKSALAQAIPEIHNSDQGSQYTSEEYIDLLKMNAVKISMDSRGRCMDNIFNERLWRAVKYEDIYLKRYCSIDEAREGLSDYFPFYNQKRRHQALANKTPAEVYANKKQ